MVFSGTVTSDFLKYLPTALDDKEKLLDYSAADFNTIRENLINYAKANFPLDYNNFSESDFGVFLIELMAAVGHIQSVKSDYLANESYIRTARDRRSVKKLLELVGVRMKGPISAAANARLVIQNVPNEILNPSGLKIEPNNRAFTVASPEDGAPLTFSVYKVNNNGTVGLDDLTLNLNFQVSANDDNSIIVDDLVILEGAFIVETGTFFSPESVKSIELSQFPYVERSAQVYIESDGDTNGIYTEEENLYFASGGSDKIFQIITDDNFKPIVVFGDSVLGLAPVIGDKYTITYRVGGGTRGNLAKEVINIPIKVKLQNVAGEFEVDAYLENTSIATGGAEAESVAHAKRYAPLVFRRQDRLVNLVDYKSFVNTFISSYGSTGKANAVVRRAYSSANIIDIFVLEKASNLQLRKATPEYKKQLLEAMEEKKMLTDEPVVVDGLIRTLDLMVNVAMDSKYKKLESAIVARTRAKILDYFNVDNTDFGEPFVPQDLIKYVLDISEIRYATVDNVEGTINVNFNEVIQLNNLTINTTFI